MADKELIGSLPHDAFHPAVLKYSMSVSPTHLPWKFKDVGTMCIYQIVQEGAYDLHLSVSYRGIFKHIEKFHFTLRKGPGKGIDAHAWFEIKGFDKQAKMIPRNNRGMINLFTDPGLPPAVKKQVARIDEYGNSIFNTAVSFVKPKR